MARKSALALIRAFSCLLVNPKHENDNHSQVVAKRKPARAEALAGNFLTDIKQLARRERLRLQDHFLQLQRLESCE